MDSVNEKKELVRKESFGYTFYDDSFVPSFSKTLENKLGDVITPTKVGTRTDILVAPIRVYADITTACNLRCPTCLNNSGRKKKGELDSSEWSKIIDGLAEDGVMDIKLTGGEPTLKKGWKQLAEQIKINNMFLTINTNGIYSSRTLNELIELQPDEVSISVDGLKSYSIMRNADVNLALSSIKELHKAGIKTIIHTLISKNLSLDEVERLVDFANDNASGIDFFPLRPLGNAYGSSSVLSYEGLKNFYVRTRHLQNKRTVADTKLLDENRMRGKLTVTELGLRKGISDGSTRLNIMSDGGIFAGGCTLYVPNLSREKIRLGFIQEEGYSIHNIWHNSKQLDSFRNQTSLASEKCDVCSEYKLKNCSGYVVEMDFFRKINKYNPHCKF